MKVSPPIALSAMLVILPSVQAIGWAFLYGNPQLDINGQGDTGCTQIVNSAGTQFQFIVPTLSTCCITVYTDDVCGHDLGWTCDDLTTTPSVNILSFIISSC
jgi:hypothetical protein